MTRSSLLKKQTDENKEIIKKTRMNGFCVDNDYRYQMVTIDYIKRLIGCMKVQIAELCRIIFDYCSFIVFNDRPYSLSVKIDRKVILLKQEAKYEVKYEVKYVVHKEKINQLHNDNKVRDTYINDKICNHVDDKIINSRKGKYKRDRNINRSRNRKKIWNIDIYQGRKKKDYEQDYRITYSECDPCDDCTCNCPVCTMEREYYDSF